MNFWPYRDICGSSATIFGVEVFGRDHPRLSPIWPFYRLFHWIDDLKWAALHRWHPRHQYNVVRTGLEPGYYDEDERMLWACMALLCQFVEYHEGPDKLDAFTAELRDNPDPNAPEGFGGGQIRTQSEAVAIYRWWKYERPENHRAHDEMLMRLYGTDKPDCRREGDSSKALDALENKNHSDDQEMLHRLIDIRPGLWT